MADDTKTEFLEFGSSFNSHPHLEVLSASSAEKLRDVLRQIRQPFFLLNMYADNGKHYAWISPGEPLRIKKVIRSK